MTPAEIASITAERDRLKRREASIIEACERVADGGQYRADIVSAIERIRRERDEAREQVKAWREWHAANQKLIKAERPLDREIALFGTDDANCDTLRARIIAAKNAERAAWARVVALDPEAAK